MIVYLICYVVSFLLSRFELYIPSGIVLLAAAVWLYACDIRRSGNLIHLRALFSLFWVGGEGLACMKLSSLSTDWSLMTWFCFLLAEVGFWFIYELFVRHFESDLPSGGRFRRYTGDARPVFHMLIALSVISLAAFITEAAVLGFIPLFMTGVPHAYSEFHLTGIHYLTVSCVLVPSLCVLYFYMSDGRARMASYAAAAVFTLISLLIPILCVSRFQFVFAVILGLFTFIALQKKFNPAWIVLIVVLIIPVYLIITVARSHDVAYLNSIFEMKNPNMPIFITQPYMYVANNYDNFNCLVEALPSHSLGFKGLLPLWTFTGLKFFFPELTMYPIYVDKIELTTLTLFYDAYYDFGFLGVLFFSALLGVVSYFLVLMLREFRNPCGFLLYAQMAVYLCLSFFTTWFSNTTTWFYLVLTALMALYYHFTARR